MYVDAGRLARPTSTHNSVLAWAERYRFCRCSPVLNAICNAGLAQPKQGTTRCRWFPGRLPHQYINQYQSIYVFNVLGGNWDPTDKKFSSVNSYRQDLLPTCKAFPKDTTTCIWFTQGHKVCNSTTVLQKVQML